jgi:hypothetical protein
MSNRASHLAVAAALSLVACGSSDTSTGTSAHQGPYRLTVRGDATFDVDAGTTVHAALHLKSTMQRLEVVEAKVEHGAPAFSFTFDPMLAPTEQYHLHYWIDSNGNGICDPPGMDELWAADPPMGDPTFVVTRQTSQESDVCGSFY